MLHMSPTPTEQVWALHDAMPEHLRAAVLLGAFAGLRVSEVCWLRVRDVDYMHGVIHPTVQYPSETLKSDTASMPVPIPQDLAMALAAHVTSSSWGETLLCNEWGKQLHPRTLEPTIGLLGIGSQDSRPASGSTTCATTTQAFSSRTAVT